MREGQALVVLSGGQDSTTCLYWALNAYGKGNVRAIGFDYGQRHANELDCARDISLEEGVPFEVLDMRLLSRLSENALTQPDIEVDGGEYEGDYPNTFVPGRNHLFLSVAAIYARKWGIRDIITGVGQGDFSGYPDCRDAFIKALNTALNLAMEEDFRLITPLMWLSKAEIWALAAKLGCLLVVKERTLTCYKGVAGKGCGQCPACILRQKGYEEYERMSNHG